MLIKCQREYCNVLCIMNLYLPFNKINIQKFLQNEIIAHSDFKDAICLYLLGQNCLHLTF